MNVENDCSVAEDLDQITNVNDEELLNLYDSVDNSKVQVSLANASSSKDESISKPLSRKFENQTHSQSSPTTTSTFEDSTKRKKKNPTWLGADQEF